MPSSVLNAGCRSRSIFISRTRARSRAAGCMSFSRYPECSSDALVRRYTVTWLMHTVVKSLGEAGFGGGERGNGGRTGAGWGAVQWLLAKRGMRGPPTVGLKRHKAATSQSGGRRGSASPQRLGASRKTPSNPAFRQPWRPNHHYTTPQSLYFGAACNEYPCWQGCAVVQRRRLLRGKARRRVAELRLLFRPSQVRLCVTHPTPAGHAHT